MSPALLAFLILLIMAAFGVWIIAKGNMFQIDGFLTWKTLDNCETDYKTCNKIQQECENEKTACVRMVNSKLDKLIETSDQLASTSTETTTPILANVLKKIQGVPGTVEPSNEQLNRVQGAELLPILGGTKEKPVHLTAKEVLALYKPAIEKIKPHQTPSRQLTALEPKVNDQDETEYADILRSSPRTASIREMIRNDVADIVREEVDGANTGNPYEVKYDYS